MAGTSSHRTETPRWCAFDFSYRYAPASMEADRLAYDPEERGETRGQHIFRSMTYYAATKICGSTFMGSTRASREKLWKYMLNYDVSDFQYLLEIMVSEASVLKDSIRKYRMTDMDSARGAWEDLQQNKITYLALIEHGMIVPAFHSSPLIRLAEDGVRKRHMLALWARPESVPAKTEQLKVLKSLEKPAVAEVWGLIGGNVFE